MGIAGLAKIDELREGALGAALAVDDEKSRLKALGHVVRNWAGKDPAAAAAWLDENGYIDSTTEWSVAQRYGKLDPEGNADWLIGRAAEENREKALSTALNGWSRTDVEAAAAWLESVGPTDGSIAIIAKGYASAADLGKGIEWAKRVSEEKRDGVIAGTLAQARVQSRELDISAYLGAGSLSAEEMAKKVEEQRKRLERF